MQQYNCVGCHEIEKRGGYIRKYYQENPTLAPPVLNGEGEKVQSNWFFSFLKAPVPIRPWLEIRMPTFGFSDEHANQLVSFFNGLAKVEIPYAYFDDKKIPPDYIDAAKQLVSKDYFNCFSCHQQGDKKPEGPVDGWAPDLTLAPLYRVDGSKNLEESILPDWPGYDGEKPVRIGNAAALHSQHDIYGEMVLALTPIFLDERMSAERSPAALKLIERLARKAVSLAGVPDAGIWEFRTDWKPQTFSSLMCWAAADRMERIATRHAPALVTEFHAAANRIREEVLAHSPLSEQCRRDHEDAEHLLQLQRLGARLRRRSLPAGT